MLLVHLSGLVSPRVQMRDRHAIPVAEPQTSKLKPTRRFSLRRAGSPQWRHSFFSFDGLILCGCSAAAGKRCCHREPFNVAIPPFKAGVRQSSTPPLHNCMRSENQAVSGSVIPVVRASHPNHQTAAAGVKNRLAGSYPP